LSGNRSPNTADHPNDDRDDEDGEYQIFNELAVSPCRASDARKNGAESRCEGKKKPLGQAISNPLDEVRTDHGNYNENPNARGNGTVPRAKEEPEDSAHIFLTSRVFYSLIFPNESLRSRG